MKKWIVYGSISVGLTIEVEAESKEDALEKAYESFGGLTNFCGNGGSDKLVGVYSDKESVEAGYGEPEFIDAEEA